jgi:beta-mannosidase
MARLSFDGAERMAANASVDREGRFEITFHLADPALWWPSGSGRQPLYVLDLELLSDNGLQDRRSLKVGVRTLTYQRCTDSPTDSIPYVVVINDRPIWIKGVNFLPIDHRFGAVDKDRYIRQVQRLKDAGVNLIRIWGGAYIEKEWLYDLCDENGILIWQELPQSNSGLDGVPSRDPSYRLALRDAAVHALKEKRNHVSLTIWDGGNELKDAARRPAGMGDEVLQELGSLVQEHDPERIFHPSSPSGPNFNLDTSVEAMREGKNHNIHGQWVYLGTKAHYSYYDSSNSLFNAEFGANGASDEESLARFLKPETLLAYKEDDPTWLLHGNGWWNSWHRDAALFGAERLDSPGRFSAASQFVQAEAIRYAIESCRRRSFQNAGCIIWQFSEPWPNVNCSNLIDWYERPKMAYHAASQAFRTLHPCLRYDQWVYTEGATFEAEAHILNSGAPVKGRLEVEILDLEGQQLHSIAWYLEVHENQNVLAGRIRMDLPQLPGSIFFVRLRLTLDIGERIETLLTFGVEEDLPQGKAPFRGLMVRSDASLRASCRMIAEDEASIELENLGAHAVVGISIYRQDGNPTWIDNGFSTLFPGESIRIRARGLEEGVPLVAKDLARNIRVPIPWIHDGQGCAETVVKNP